MGTSLLPLPSLAGSDLSSTCLYLSFLLKGPWEENPLQFPLPKDPQVEPLPNLQVESLSGGLSPISFLHPLPLPLPLPL